MSRVILYKDADFCVEGEVMDDLFYMHVNVSNYNKSVKKKMNSVWLERIDSLIKVINKHDSEIDDLKRKVVENSIRLGVIDEKLRDRKGS